MRRRLGNLFEGLRSSYWFIPTLMTLFSAVLAVVMIRLDQGLQLGAFRSLGFVYFNQPDGARALVSTVASSMITVAGTTLFDHPGGLVAHLGAVRPTPAKHLYARPR